jgi:hypothetical protein
MFSRPTVEFTATIENQHPNASVTIASTSIGTITVPEVQRNSTPLTPIISAVNISELPFLRASQQLLLLAPFEHATFTISGLDVATYNVGETASLRHYEPNGAGQYDVTFQYRYGTRQRV